MKTLQSKLIYFIGITSLGLGIAVITPRAKADYCPEPNYQYCEQLYTDCLDATIGQPIYIRQACYYNYSNCVSQTCTCDGPGDCESSAASCSEGRCYIDVDTYEGE